MSRSAAEQLAYSPDGKKEVDLNKTFRSPKMVDSWSSLWHSNATTNVTQKSSKAKQLSCNRTVIANRSAGEIPSD